MPEINRKNSIIDSEFKAPWWLKNRHAQTMYPSFPWSGVPRIALRNEVLELPDGDVTTVDWLQEQPDLDSVVPTLVILHGLEGSANSTYARLMLHAAAAHGWRAAVLHFRDCGDYRNRLPRRYHAGETDDIRYFLERLRITGHDGPLVAVGYSLGGNILLKYLGENGASTPLGAAAAVCAPLNLHDSAKAISTGFSKVYQYHLLKRMKKAVARKFDPHTAAFDWNRTMQARTFAEFDDAVTAPLHGFSGKDEYYDRCSSIGFLSDIQRPTLLINALDDPFMMPAAIPDASRLSDSVQIEVSSNGGHVGFISGGTPWRPKFYLPGRIIDYLETAIEDQDGANQYGRPLSGM